MKTFLKYLVEANAVGSKFEKKTAKMVNEWLKANELDGKWEARRFQTVDESARQEDYSDVVVENRKTGEKFFIECKEADRSNVVNIQFDVTKDGTLVPVRDKSRERLSEAENDAMRPFVEAIQRSEGFKSFLSFMDAANELISDVRPAVLYFGEEDVDDGVLASLIKKYNGLVKSGAVEADCKEFDPGNLRASTKNMLAVALAWRLSEKGRTWDICKLDSMPDFGRLIRRHYSDGKKIPARYIQFNDKLFRLDPENDPFSLPDVPEFPDGAKGKFALKFTPRFGTGSVYVTPRSELAEKLESGYSFIDRKKWPEPR